jgi:hypothetical protein
MKSVPLRTYLTLAGREQNRNIESSQPMSIAAMRRYLERVEGHGREQGKILPFGLAAIDEHLPHRGLPRGHLHEAIEGDAASQYAGLATLFAAGILPRRPGEYTLRRLHSAKRHAGFAPAEDRSVICALKRLREGEAIQYEKILLEQAAKLDRKYLKAIQLRLILIRHNF